MLGTASRLTGIGSFSCTASSVSQTVNSRGAPTLACRGGPWIPSGPRPAGAVRLEAEEWRNRAHRHRPTELVGAWTSPSPERTTSGPGSAASRRHRPCNVAGTVTVKTPRSRRVVAAAPPPPSGRSRRPPRTAAARRASRSGCAAPRHWRRAPRPRRVRGTTIGKEVGCRPSYSFGTMKLSGPSGISTVVFVQIGVAERKADRAVRIRVPAIEEGRDPGPFSGSGPSGRGSCASSAGALMNRATTRPPTIHRPDT